MYLITLARMVLDKKRRMMSGGSVWRRLEPTGDGRDGRICPCSITFSYSGTWLSSPFSLENSRVGWIAWVKTYFRNSSSFYSFGTCNPLIRILKFLWCCCVSLISSVNSLILSSFLCLKSFSPIHEWFNLILVFFNSSI